MKKLLLLFLMLTGALVANAQIMIGVNGGIPVGDAEDAYSFAAGVDIYYMLGDKQDMFNAGVVAGFINYFGEETDAGPITIEVDDAQFIPIGGAARVTLAEFLNLGVDVGYGIALEEGADGGFHWRILGGVEITDQFSVNLHYHNITRDEFDISNVGLQFIYALLDPN